MDLQITDALLVVLVVAVVVVAVFLFLAGDTFVDGTGADGAVAVDAR